MILLGRLGAHGLAIVVVGAALVGASISRPADALQSAEPEFATAASDSATPTQMSLDLASVPAPPPPTGGAVTATDGQLRPTVTFDPRVGMPQWLRAIRDVTLWPSSDPAATSNGTVPAFSTYVKPLGAVDTSRIEVYYPGDAEHPAMQAWVDSAAFEPSGVPPWIAPPALSADQPSPNAGVPRGCAAAFQ